MFAVSKRIVYFTIFCLGREDVDNVSYNWTFGKIIFLISSQYEFVGAKKIWQQNRRLKSFPKQTIKAGLWFIKMI